MTWKLENNKWIHQENLNVDRANELLCYAISVLNNKSGMVATEKGKLEVALALKRDLVRMKAYWQVKVLEYHLHQWQKRRFKR